MNKVITINLGGNAYQLEEGGYDALRAYLETAAARLQGNPDRDEILSDIERAIAEKFRALLASHKTVVETKEVAAVLAEMGPIEADPGEADGRRVPGGAQRTRRGGRQNEQRGAADTPRRLYRIHEGAMIAGVCNGIAAYVNIDPTLVRLAFVLLTMFWGTGLLVYVVMAIVVPEARSPEEKAAASGDPSTAQEFIRRAKEGYYEAMKGFPDRKARREWKRRFKREMRANADQWRYNWHSYWAEHAPRSSRNGLRAAHAFVVARRGDDPVDLRLDLAAGDRHRVRAGPAGQRAGVGRGAAAVHCLRHYRGAAESGATRMLLGFGPAEMDLVLRVSAGCSGLAGGRRRPPVAGRPLFPGIARGGSGHPCRSRIKPRTTSGRGGMEKSEARRPGGKGMRLKSEVTVRFDWPEGSHVLPAAQGADSSKATQ